MKAPPPPASTMMATNLGLTAQKELSHVTLETRMSSYIWSAFTGCPKTCRNLLWRTTRRLMAGGRRVRPRPPPAQHGGVSPPHASHSETPPPTLGTGRSLGTWRWRGMRVQDGAPCGPVPVAGTGGSPCAGGCGCCKCRGQASRSRSHLMAGQGHGRAMMRSCAVPCGCAVPRGWHWGWHMSSCSGEAGLRGVWGGHGGAMHQVKACPLVSHPASVARGCLARPSTQERGRASSVAHPTPPPMGPT